MLTTPIAFQPTHLPCMSLHPSRSSHRTTRKTAELTPTTTEAHALQHQVKQRPHRPHTRRQAPLSTHQEARHLAKLVRTTCPSASPHISEATASGLQSLTRLFCSGDCGLKLQGIPATRPRESAKLSRPTKSVSRSYGGSRCANCVRDRVVRAFLIEEQKIVKKVLKESQQKRK